ncbi:MAG: chemotaxis protein CheX [Deltaproteobacteria bacterium]|nr:chemotaxis protein CheX [Deltaproteobacteria bacterium]
MDSKFVKPFIDATVKVLETMAFTVPTVGETCLWEQNHAVADVVGIVGLTSDDEVVRGALFVGFAAPSIIQIVSNMFGEEYETMNDEVREAVGEIANMISGQARQALSAMDIKLQGSLPTIISGKEIDIEGPVKKPLIMVKFSVEKGPFELGLCIDGLSEE